MKEEYKIVHYYDVKRLIIQLEIEETDHILDKIKSLSKNIAKYLKSDILYENVVFFDKIYKNFTYVAILSTSHIIVSSYINNDYKVLDIDVSWCSGVDIRRDYVYELFRKEFGDKYKILSIKYLDNSGNELSL